MKFLSLFSGIEAASVAFEPLGWECVGVAEVEPQPCKLLALRYPNVPNLGDVTAEDFPARAAALLPDVVVGGPPCQAFSVAGLRKSLSDDRGNLTLRFVQILEAVDAARKEAGLAPVVVLIENVVGILSVADNAFGCLLGALVGEDQPLDPAGGRWSHAGCVFGPQRAVAWRVLNAQHFGHAQRRKRVFVVASPLEVAHPTQILFECEGGDGDSEPCPAQAEESSGQPEGGAGEDGIEQPYRVANCLTRRMHKGINTTLDEGQTPVLAYRVAGDGAAYETEEHTAPLTTRTDRASTVVLAYVKGTNPHSADECPTYRETETAACLTGWDARHNPPKHLVGPVVRVLMPVECERLQGFPALFEKVEFDVCIDPQSNSVVADHQCHRWQSSAGIVGKSESTPRALTAVDTSSTDLGSQKQRVVLRVLTLSGVPRLELHSQGRLLWPAYGVGAAEASPLRTQSESSAQELAQRLQGLVREALTGGAVSPAYTRLSTLEGSGKVSAGRSGAETLESANAAGSAQPGARSTMSSPGPATRNSDSSLETLFSCAMGAISGLIPATTLPDAFSVEVVVERGYTDIPGTSDTARYKALGNSWPVLVIRWLGRRIQGAVR